MTLVRKLVLNTFILTLLLRHSISILNPMQILFLVISGIVFVNDASGSSRPNSITPNCLGVLTVETNKLLQASMTESTWHINRSACASFNQFMYLFRLPLTWPAPLDQVVHFIAYMSVQGRAPGSIRTYISGLSYMYKIHGLEDVTKSFIVTKMLEGAAR